MSTLFTSDGSYRPAAERTTLYEIRRRYERQPDDSDPLRSLGAPTASAGRSEAA